ncbi:MAG: TRAP transporter small permease [Pelagimonas sp.]|uniref:TRAP transporter small permease n=1 Tax=Pelagimonas sp. TaxID=2073170 RepID=UPI003D6BBCD9
MARAFDLFLNILAILAAALLFSLIFIIAADVTLRTFADRSLTWVLEASETSLVAVLALGLPWLARERGHISVDLVTNSLQPRTRAVLARAIALVCAGLLGWLSFWAFQQASDDFARGIQTIGIHPFPRFLMTGGLGAGLGLTALEYGRQLFLKSVSIHGDEGGFQ